MGRPTINDVARVAGVSKKTVSRVINQSPLLNEATRARVEQVIAELGYVPDPQARALALRRKDSEVHTGANSRPSASKLIALVHDASAAPQLADLQHGVLDALSGTDFALTPCLLATADLDSELRAFLERHRPTSVLFVPPLSEYKLLAALCAELDCRFACLGSGASADAARLFASDDRQAAARAIAYLISLGHERIGMVTGPEDSRLAQERELGYLDAMADHELDRGPALIASGDHSFQSGYAAGQLLLEVSPRPTAILAGNDDMAAGVLHAAAEKGIKVPDALSIVGFEDTAIASRLHPQLTTVRVPFAEMARAAALSLLSDDGEAVPQTRFAASLVARASTAPCPT